MSILSYIGILGGICSLLGYIPYARRIVEGKEHPERTTWLIWTLSNALILLSYFVLGARTTVWVPTAYLLGSAFVTILAFKYGQHGWGFVEKIALAIAIITSIRWVYFDKPMMTLFLNLAIGMTGYVRRIKLLLLDRTAQEDIAGWTLYFVGALLNLAAVNNWNDPAISILPIALVTMNGLVFLLTLKNRLNAKSQVGN